jgi:hypothetical protein
MFNQEWATVHLSEVLVGAERTRLDFQWKRRFIKYELSPAQDHDHRNAGSDVSSTANVGIARLVCSHKARARSGRRRGRSDLDDIFSSQFESWPPISVVESLLITDGSLEIMGGEHGSGIGTGSADPDEHSRVLRIAINCEVITITGDSDLIP